MKKRNAKSVHPDSISGRLILEKENLLSDEELHISSYFLDFAWPEKKKYLEVDGDQHYVDKRIIEHDKKRTKILEELGWKVFRVKWSEYQSCSREEKEEVVKNFKKFLNE